MEKTRNMQEELFAYVRENTFKDTKNLTSDTKLFVEGIFDSMGFVLLLDFLEEKYKVVPSDEDLVEENFESIDAIISYVERKHASVAQ